MPGWENLATQIDLEVVQCLQEGVEPAAAQAAGQTARRRLTAGADEFAVWAAFDDLPLRSDFPFVEPDALDDIHARRPPAPTPPPPAWQGDDEQLLDRLHGAWLGRCVGCALGKPVECFMGSHNGLASWERQKQYLTAISAAEWPLHDYFPAHSPAEATTGSLGCPLSTREQIAFMETDDDIRYTVLGQMVMQRWGRQFASSQVAHTWFDRLGYLHVCTAETQAYRNLVLRYDSIRRPLSASAAQKLDTEVDWHWLSHHVNPYREWIGAQIRVDSYGYACPGQPELAAELAWRDARLSHAKNGLYGAMLCAAMIAAAFASDNPQAIVEAGLAQIPATSRLAAELRQVIAICNRHHCERRHFEAVFQEIYDLLGHYHPVHTNNNAALCVAAVLLGGGQFADSITLAVMGGLDTDCNGATVGSIVGAMTGAARAPQQWTAPLHDTLNSLIADYHPISIRECARRSLAIVRAGR